MISSFAGKYRFLSNFWPCKVAFEGQEYPSVEHAYQAAKTLSPEERAHIRKADSAAKAKNLGKQVTVRADWDTRKLDIMAQLVWRKFYFNPELGKQLKATGDEELVEGNTWGDTFWGVCGGKGQNHLGRILMEVRRNQLEIDFDT